MRIVPCGHAARLYLYAAASAASNEIDIERGFRHFNFHSSIFDLRGGRRHTSATHIPAGA